MTLAEILCLPKLDSNDEYERICAILCPNESLEDEEDTFEPPESSEEALACYQHFLKSQLKAGFKVTGRDDMGYFCWEESFCFGEGSAREYTELKKTKASFDDKFEWIRLVDWNITDGLMAEVKRIKDRKQFIIPLIDLAVCRTKIKEYQLVEDYSSWFANFGPEAS